MYEYCYSNLGAISAKGLYLTELTRLAIQPQPLKRSNLNITRIKKPAFLFLVKLGVDRRACDKYKMVQCEQSANENNVFKRKLSSNTCSYCSKFILDEATRLIQLHGVLTIMCVTRPPKRYCSKAKSQIVDTDKLE